MRWHNLIASCAIVLACSNTSFSASTPPKSFEGGEHVTLGDKVQLFFSADQPGQSHYIFHLINGLNISFGEIVSLGDFYEILGRPISSGTTLEERKHRFIKAFETFSSNKGSVTETTEIINVLHEEQAEVVAGLERGEKAPDIYDRIAPEKNRKFNCITGGGCGPTWYLEPGRYLLLASDDYDHFGADAWLSYQAGHEVALDQALLARQNHDLSQLELAYAYDAFADHFLSDRYAAGHMRTPRRALPENVTPALVGDLLSSFMHGEENTTGLHTYNGREDKWIAYGDRYYFEKPNAQNSLMLQEMMQASANQIYSAYQEGVRPSTKDLAQLLPHPQELRDQGHIDPAPLFYWNPADEKLYRRVDVHNPYDYHWTTDWWGWSTLILLSQGKPLPAEDQGALARSPYAETALAAGLISDNNIAKAIKQKEK